MTSNNVPNHTTETDHQPDHSASDAVPITPADRARIARQEQLLDQMMERKLSMLDAEYAQCIDAERMPAEPAASNMDETDDDDGSMEQYSQAWMAFKQDMEEERERQRIATFDEDDDEHEEEEEEEDTLSSAATTSSTTPNTTTIPPETSRLATPLTSAQITSILQVMSTIKLRPPPWAIAQGLSEEVWMNRILERAGFRRRSQQQVTEENKNNNMNEEKHANNEIDEKEQRRRRKEKKKLKKARLAAKRQKEAERAAAIVTATATTTTTQTTSEVAISRSNISSATEQKTIYGTATSPVIDEEFETSFPSIVPESSSTVLSNDTIGTGDNTSELAADNHIAATQ